MGIHEISAAIDQLGLRGRPVCVHSSFRSLLPIVTGPNIVVGALLDAGCTVLVPTFSWAAFAHPPEDPWMPARNGVGPDYVAGAAHGRIFHTKSNAIDDDMGAIPRQVLHAGQRRRGNHPLCSFAAIGPQSERLVDGQTPGDVFAPLRALCDLDGRVVLMGVDLTSMTLLHLAEQVAGRSPFVRWALDDQRRVINVRVGGCSAGFFSFDDVLGHDRCAVGSGQWCAFDASEAVRAASDAIRRRPPMTRCKDPRCERCEDAVAGGPVPIP
jgi:aminoglycoside 3-N-acetyltransferase